jgi:hypothetical protein
MRTTKTERDDARRRLLEILDPGDTVTTVLRHVSASGMSRRIDLYAIKCDHGRPYKLWLSRLAAIAAGWTFDEAHECVRVSGCGMDMGYHLVSNLSSTLWPYGTTVRCSGPGCPSNAHNNKPYPKPDRRKMHPANGYQLRHEWL